ncbi:hypothetical protein NYE76_00280 [Paenibacillus sp. FSL M7-0831]
MALYHAFGFADTTGLKQWPGWAFTLYIPSAHQPLARLASSESGGSFGQDLPRYCCLVRHQALEAEGRRPLGGATA